MRAFIISLFMLITLANCANQTSPTGGPQDKKPPELIKSNPKNNELNFKNKSLELEFNEDIKLKDPTEEIIITPSVGKKSKILAKANKVIITPETPWKENTTYSVSFRDAVQDLNEGNPIFNLRLAFSTGPEIDSLSLTGRVYEVSKEEVPDKITVALYQSDTFNIFNHQPTYFTRANKKGKFSINNLKEGDYYIYAFDDKSKNLKVDSKTERFGFLTRKIELTIEKQDSLIIPITKVDARPLKITSIRHTEKLSRIKFNKSIDTLKVKTDNYPLLYQFGDTREEIIFYNPPKEDSIKFTLYATDSTTHTIDTTAYLRTTKTKLPKETFKFSLEEPIYDIESQKITIKAKFNKPILAFTLDSLYIQLDTTNFQSIQEKEITIDTINHQLTIETSLKPLNKDPSTKTPDPIFIAGKGSFISIDQDSSKSATNKIRIPKVEETGSLSIDVKTEEKNYILQLYGKGAQPIRTVKNVTKYTFKNLAAQEYKIKVLIDMNNNGIWDVGNFEFRKEPEPIYIYKTKDGKTSTLVRANWEVGPLLITF